MGYRELIDSLRNPPEDGLPDTIYDDLISEYDNLASSSAAAVNERDEQLSAVTTENASLKARNYDLLMSVGVAGEPVINEDTIESENVTIDSLFVEN